MIENGAATEYIKHNCPSCGAPFLSGNAVIVCEYCGAVFSEEGKYGGDIQVLIESGRADFLINKFEDARQKFAAVLKVDPRNAVANWYMLMCVNGIRHEFDRLSNKHIYTPMWHNPQSVLEGQYYEVLQAAVANGELPEDSMRALQEIEALRIEINDSLKYDKNYDVFICYKHTTEALDGTTFDKDRAYSLHSKLTKLGCTPFCAGLDLSGDKVNPKIFNALLKSKVMFVIASKKEYVNPGSEQSIWICNEWQRFLRLKFDFLEHKDKQIVPLYFHPNTAYIFPPELREFQAFEYNDITDDFDRFFENNLEELIFKDRAEEKLRNKKSERENLDRLMLEAEQERIAYEASKRMEAIIDEKIRQLEEKQRAQEDDTKKRAQEEAARIEAEYKEEIAKLNREREELKNRSNQSSPDGAKNKNGDGVKKEQGDIFERASRAVYNTASKIGASIKNVTQNIFGDDEAAQKAKREREEKARIKQHEKQRKQAEKEHEEAIRRQHEEFKAKNKRLREEHGIKIKKEHDIAKHNAIAYKNEKAEAKRKRKEYFAALTKQQKTAKLEKNRIKQEKQEQGTDATKIQKSNTELKKAGKLINSVISIVVLLIIIFTAINYFQNKSASSKFAGGSGSESNPYLITEIGMLQNIYAAPGKYFKLKNDIDCEGLTFTTVITEFSGYLDGGGYTIKNLKITSNAQGSALFYRVSGRIENLKLEVVGFLKDSGGIAGIAYILTGAVDNCTAAVTIQNENAKYKEVGAIAAIVRDGGSVTNCAGSMSLKVNTVKSAGGIAGGVSGKNHQNKAAVIKDCTAVINAELKEGSIGGIAGVCGQYAKITDCVSSGTIKELAGNVVCGETAGENYGELHGNTSMINIHKHTKLVGSQQVFRGIDFTEYTQAA